MAIPGSHHISRLTCDFRDGVVCHFVPHEKNGYLPHVLKHRVLTGYSAIAILLKALLIIAPTVLPVAAVYSSAVTASNIITLTNVARVAVGLPELQSEGRLAAAASGKAADIIEKQYFAHVSPDGTTPWDWIRGAGYDYRHSGENLALHFFTAEGVHEGWMTSPTHRQNIVDPRYTEIGVGVQQGMYQGYDTVVVVQMFGVPKTAVAAAPAPQPVAPKPAPAPAAATAIPDTSTASEPGAVLAGTETQTADPVEKPPAQPAATEPVAKPPVVDLSSVKVVPTENGYAVAAKVQDAVSVEAYLGTESVSLVKDAEGSWEGELPKSETPTDADYLFVGAQDEAGKRTYGPVAVVLPDMPTAGVFAGGNEPSGTLSVLGFRIGGLSDAIRRFYIIGLILLAAALAIKVLVNIRIQHPSVIMHALFVLGLFGALLRF